MNKTLSVKLENKNITFKDINILSYIYIQFDAENDLTVIAQKLSNGSYYFDISEITSKALTFSQK